jgi:hypothetical protein
MASVFFPNAKYLWYAAPSVKKTVGAGRSMNHRIRREFTHRKGPKFLEGTPYLVRHEGVRRQAAVPHQVGVAQNRTFHHVKWDNLVKYVEAI